VFIHPRPQGPRAQAIGGDHSHRDSEIKTREIREREMIPNASALSISISGPTVTVHWHSKNIVGARVTVCSCRVFVCVNRFCFVLTPPFLFIHRGLSSLCHPEKIIPTIYHININIAVERVAMRFWPMKKGIHAQ